MDTISLITTLLLCFLAVCLSSPVLTPEGWNESDSEYFDYRRWKILDPNWPSRNKREIIVSRKLGDSEMTLEKFEELFNCTRFIDKGTTEIPMDEKGLQVVDEGTPLQEEIFTDEE